MKPNILFLFLFTVCACSPDFHKQKYTNFGHGKAEKLKTNIAEEKATVLHKEKPGEESGNEMAMIHKPAEVEQSVESKIPKEGFVLSLTEISSLADHAVHSKPLEDSLKIQPPNAADSPGAILYSRQLKREATRNLMLGAAEIAIGILAFFVLPYWLPVLIVHAVIGVIFLLVASHKIVKSNEVLQYPQKYKNPRGINRLDTSLFHLSHIGYMLFLISVTIGLFMIAVLLTTEYLAYFLLALIALYVIPVPLAMVALLLLLIAAMKGRNYIREENLRDLPPTERVKWYNAINWSVVALAFTALVVWISHMLDKE